MKSIVCAVLLLLVHQLFLCGQQDSVRYLPDYSADRIMLTIPGDPATSRAVTWRTKYEITESFGQITEASPSPFMDSVATWVEGTHQPWEDSSDNAMGHLVIFQDLKPETEYAYRVGEMV